MGLEPCDYRGELKDGLYSCDCLVVHSGELGQTPEQCSTCQIPKRRKEGYAFPRRSGARVESKPIEITDEEKDDYPNAIQLGWTFLREWRVWRKAGKPVVSVEVRQQRRELCLACEKYDAAQDRCTKCGCYLHRIKVGGVIDADALSWATKQCPLAKW